MKNMISELTIKNFKSIKDITLSCKQVNIFVGKPNTGKSNILEAISLLSGGGLVPGKRFFDGAIHYESLDNLFYDQDNSQVISVESSIGSAQLSFFHEDEKFGYFGDSHKTQALRNVLNYSSNIDAYQNLLREKEFAEAITEKINPATYLGSLIYDDGKVERMTSPAWLTPVRNYLFKRQVNIGSSESNYLLPPHGENLWSVMQRTPKLREIAGEFFKQFGLDLVLVHDEKIKKIKIQKESDGIFIHFPYSLVADTLQRMIFHLAAIYSNRDAVILFEEPEAHTYAPYQSYLAGEIIEDEQNQYFITTHSEQIFDSILRPNPEKVAVFFVDYQDYQTIVRSLSEEEISDLLNSYTSIFQNLDGYAVP